MGVAKKKKKGLGYPTKDNHLRTSSHTGIPRVSNPRGTPRVLVHGFQGLKASTHPKKKKNPNRHQTTILPIRLGHQFWSENEAFSQGRGCGALVGEISDGNKVVEVTEYVSFQSHGVKGSRKAQKISHHCD